MSVPDLAIGHRHDRRPGHVVVVARHRSAVRARRRYGDQVARDDITWQELIAHQDVAALAVLTDDSGEGRCGGRPPEANVAEYSAA